MAVAITEPQDPEIDMSKVRLHLICCSGGIEPEVVHRRRGRSFQLSIIDGGKRATAAPGEKLWEATLNLFDLGILVAQVNYLAFVAASLTVLELQGWADPKQAS
jgi:hypothetical protein